VRRAGLLLTALLFSGCATDRPGPRRPQPPDVIPTQLVMSVGPFEDTNRNGYPDSATVTVYVFSDSYPEASILLPATLTFKLTGRRSGIQREWAFNEEQTRSLLRRGPAGPGYVVRLSLLDNSQSDEIRDTRADLVALYRTASGVEITSAVEEVVVGRAPR
jgi:hypothetical protein